MSGRVVHFEIPFDDGDRARTFYSDAFGWKVEEMPELDYTSVVSGPVSEEGMPLEPGFINGGMFKRDNGPLSGPIITIDVEDIDSVMAKIESAGGTAVGEKLTVGEMGFAAYFRDPEGNVVGLWQNA
ncbi:VOC family protein [Arthrobacter sp. JZ12]|uniref:VOC family protein n=1 Tax=Arthrobacter sp. JZ12 TaxID=2654190 RepID=UPI002B461F46|nr:VOC family protein [Arthrobacter sp. JZ12]WRH24544.1 VOC family protein [Arthrobacter sp. JZ12]